MAELKSFDILKDRLRICKNCDKKDCRKGIFGAPPPQDCPYILERVMFEQEEFFKGEQK